MAWYLVETRYCPILKTEVALLEQRIYPRSDHLSDMAYRVLARRCSHDLICNANDHIHCRWAYTNPAWDPFEEGTD
ncbi:MAG: hypothetical protein RQ891_00140 [Thermoflexus sp.]|jgi:hypothetical protein|uniref:hypothetical protein n=1 Tax=Thermoflexus TaxID=1495649 RepID=UPI001C799465|nr:MULTISPECIES: hypothetical protein [Thermoflexus]MDT7883250.1 hypothetical protein [Thermoflexus sp.]MDT7946753.1 hypothetical protein [Thermoflexus sp.]QWK11308.1 MAG: hypothetical protein KNN16_03275 [Thermoflexus hugenholtzii]